MRLRALLCTLALLLAACGHPAPKPAEPAADPVNPISGSAIAVTPIVTETPAAAAPGPAVAAQPGAIGPQTAPLMSLPDAAPLPSAAEMTCRRQGGMWTTAGVSGSETCIRSTRDAGKQCTRDSDCEGACLARSGTCAPVNPMMGCNDVLQDNGMMVTLCIN